MKKILALVEKQIFGVCTYIGEKTGVATASVRLFFIYASFLTFGSPVIIYLCLAFVMNLHKHLRRSRSSVWDI